MFTGAEPPPWEYVSLVLRRDVYHCTPSVFNQESWEDVAMDIHLLGIEAKVNEHKNKKKSGMTGSQKGEIPNKSN